VYRFSCRDEPSYSLNDFIILFHSQRARILLFNNDDNWRLRNGPWHLARPHNVNIGNDIISNCILCISPTAISVRFFSLFSFLSGRVGILLTRVHNIILLWPIRFGDCIGRRKIIAAAALLTSICVRSYSNCCTSSILRRPSTWSLRWLLDAHYYSNGRTTEYTWLQSDANRRKHYGNRRKVRSTRSLYCYYIIYR